MGKKWLTVDRIATEEVEDELASCLSVTAGSSHPIVRWDQTYAVALRCSSDAEAVFVSPGNGISMDSAAALAKRCSAEGFDIPLPVFYADAAGRAHVAQCIQRERNARRAARRPRSTADADGWSVVDKSRRAVEPSQPSAVEGQRRQEEAAAPFPGAWRAATSEKADGDDARLVKAGGLQQHSMAQPRAQSRLNIGAAEFVPSFVMQVS